MRGMFWFIGLLVLGGFALLAGSIGYGWGLAAGTAQVVAPGTAVPVVYAHPFGFGFGGFLFFLLVIGLLLAVVRRRRWAGGPGHGWGPGWSPGMGHGPWGPRFDPNDPRARAWTEGDVPPQLRPMLEGWHRRAHGESGATGPGTASGGPAAGGEGTGSGSAGAPGDPAGPTGGH